MSDSKWSSKNKLTTIGNGTTFCCLNEEDVDGNVIVPVTGITKLNLQSVTGVTFGNIMNVDSEYGVRIGNNGNKFTNNKKNIALGENSLEGYSGGGYPWEGHNNIGIGINTLKGINSGNNNIAIGESALKIGSDGSNNIAIGLNSLSTSTNSMVNIAIGDYSMGDMDVSGTHNIGLGYASLAGLTTGDRNVCVGLNSLTETNVGSNNTAIGAYSGSQGDYTNTICIGSNVSANNTNDIQIGNTGNTSFNVGGGNLISLDTSQVSSNLQVAGGLLDIASTNNGSHVNSNGLLQISNTLTGGMEQYCQIGVSPLYLIDMSYSPTAGSKSCNILDGLIDVHSTDDGSGMYSFLGGGRMLHIDHDDNSVRLNTGGATNATGSSANKITLGNNSVTGFTAGSAINIQNGSSIQTCIIADGLINAVSSGTFSVNGGDLVYINKQSNSIALNTTEVPANNEIMLGNTSINKLSCNVQTISAISDKRDKKDIVPLTNGIDFINELTPVEFTWNMRDGGRVGDKDMGFIAQELLEVQEKTQITVPGLVTELGVDKLGASYATLLPLMVKSIQDLSKEIENLKQQINDLKK